MIVKFDSWLNERYDEVMDQFMEDLRNVCDELYKGQTSYSVHAVNHVNDDFEGDFAKVDAEMSKRGWTRAKVETLIKNDPALAVERYNSIGPQSGYGDNYLYHFNGGPNEQYFELAGYMITDMVDREKAMEMVIKFGYGYHKTSYGIKYIEQNFGTVDKFISEMPAATAKALEEDPYGYFPSDMFNPGDIKPGEVVGENAFTVVFKEAEVTEAAIEALGDFFYGSRNCELTADGNVVTIKWIGSVATPKDEPNQSNTPYKVD